jgi:cytochrome c oxidase assembly protein subunit 16
LIERCPNHRLSSFLNNIIHLTMAVFPSKKFRSTAEANTIASRYRSSLARHPFLLFGLPFIVTMVAGSFFLTPATAIRYEKYDRRVRRLSKEEELGIGKAGRRVDMKEEYYVSGRFVDEIGLMLIYWCLEARSKGFGRLGTETC